MIRIGIDYRAAFLSRAGIARCARELADALAGRDDVDCRLFAHSLASARVPIRVPGRARLCRLPIPGRTLPMLARLGLGADRLVGGADVFHYVDFAYPPVSTARAVVTLHDVAFAEDEAHHGRDSGVLRARVELAVRTAALVVTPTAASARAAATHLGIDAARIRVVPFGADHVPPEPGPDPRPGRPYFLALGTIEPRKNHGRLLAAWRSLPAPRPDLVVIGAPGWEVAALAAELGAAAAAGELTWLRAASDDVVYRHLRHARALVYPSLLEGFGFPPLEALRLGTPVVAGDTPALREVLGDCVTYCEPASTEAIAAAMARHCGPAGGATLETVARGRERAAGFTWRRCAERHADLYREALA